jgi:hypothetical protein
MPDRFTICRSILPLVVFAAACGSGGLHQPADRPDAAGTGGAIPSSGDASGPGGTTSSATTTLGGAGGASLGTGGAVPGAGGATPGTGGAFGLGGRSATTAPTQGGAITDAAGSGGAVADAKDGDAIDAALPGTDVALVVDAGTMDAGVPPDTFCIGNAAKVAFKNQAYWPAVTTKETDPMLSCCAVFAARMHLRSSLGSDLEVVVRIMGGGAEQGTYVLGDSGSRLAATLRPSGDGTDAGRPSDTALTGTASILGTLGASAPWQLGLCVAVDDPASSFAGLRVYVPGVSVAPLGWANRFGIWRLADPTIDSMTAAQSDLDSLVLASQPVVNLRDIDYVQLPPTCPADYSSPCDMWLGLNLAFLAGSQVQSDLGRVGLSGVPFLVVADEQRIYLGSFTTLISSYAIAGPEVMVENIADAGFAIVRPANMRPTPPDPRADPRIVKVLTEAGKAVP